MSILKRTATAGFVAALALVAASPTFARSRHVTTGAYDSYAYAPGSASYSAEPGYGVTYSAPPAWEPGLASPGYDNRAEWPD